MKHVAHTLKCAYRQNQRTSLAVGILLITVIFLGFYVKNDQIKPTDSLDVLWSGNYTKERAYWKKEVDSLGTEKAYEIFKTSINGKEFGVAHTLSHIMGELIYEKEGIHGIVICDASFAFGCYHSFFGRAITEGGIDSAVSLDDLCVKKFGPLGLGCPHGIGHGVLGYLGDDALDQALDICSKLSWKGTFGGCQSGVFMEYNFHTMQSLKGIESRHFNPQKPYSPCDTVNKKFTQSCYFELPKWHYNIESHDYIKTGVFCDSVAEGLGKDACFKGLGDSIGAGTQYSVVESINYCDSMPTHRDALLCRAGASWSFFAEPTAKNQAKYLCDGLSASDMEFCNKQAKIII